MLAVFPDLRLDLPSELMLLEYLAQPVTTPTQLGTSESDTPRL